LITESDRKSDRVDAESLARLARADRLLLAPIQHRTQEKQVQLSIIRARHVLVRSRTALINCARGLVKPMGLRLPACSAEAFAKRAAATSLPELLRVALGPLLKQVEAVNQAIRDYDRQIEQIAATQYPETCLLKQIKGVGTLISLTYVLTLEDPHRFAKSRDVGAFLGFLPREKQSGERAPRLGISRAGNEYLRTLLVQGAHYILGPLGPDTDLRRWGLQLAARGGGGAKKRAVTAVARKLSVLLPLFLENRGSLRAYKENPGSGEPCSIGQCLVPANAVFRATARDPWFGWAVCQFRGRCQDCSALHYIRTPTCTEPTKAHQECE